MFRPPGFLFFLFFFSFKRVLVLSCNLGGPCGREYKADARAPPANASCYAKARRLEVFAEEKGNESRRRRRKRKVGELRAHTEVSGGREECEREGGAQISLRLYR